MMVSDPWASSRWSAHGDDVEATAAPTAQDPWATQEQPTVAAPAPESFAPRPAFAPAPAFAPTAADAGPVPPVVLPVVPPVPGYPAGPAYGEEPEATVTAASSFFDVAPAAPAMPAPVPAASAPSSGAGPVDFASLVHELAGAPAPASAQDYLGGDDAPGIPDFVISGAPPVPAPGGMPVPASGPGVPAPIPAVPAPMPAVPAPIPAVPSQGGPVPAPIPAVPAPIPAVPTAAPSIPAPIPAVPSASAPAAPIPAVAADPAPLDATYTVGGTPVPVPPGRYADGAPSLEDPAAYVQPAPAGGVPIPPGGPGSSETATIAVGTYEIPASVERTAVPMPDLESTSSGESTVVVGRYGPYDFVIRLADGQGHPVDRPLLLGRRPDLLRAPEQARSIVVDDPQRTVSRSHLLIEPRPDGILLRNLSLVNALVLVSPEGDEAEVEPGGAITVTGACNVVLGAYPIAVERV